MKGSAAVASRKLAGPGAVVLVVLVVVVAPGPVVVVLGAAVVVVTGAVLLVVVGAAVVVVVGGGSGSVAGGEPARRHRMATAWPRGTVVRGRHVRSGQPGMTPKAEDQPTAVSTQAPAGTSV